MKKILSLALALAMMLSLAACGGGSSGTKTDSSGGNSGSERTLRRRPSTIIWILRSRLHPKRSALNIFVRRWNWSQTMLMRSFS